MMLQCVCLLNQKSGLNSDLFSNDTSSDEDQSLEQIKSRVKQKLKLAEDDVDEPEATKSRISKAPKELKQVFSLI